MLCCGTFTLLKLFMTIEEARKLMGDLWKDLSDEEILFFEQFCRKISRSVIRYNRRKQNGERNKSQEIQQNNYVL